MSIGNMCCTDIKLKLALAEQFVPRSMFDVVEKPPKHCPLAISDDPFLPESKLPDIVSKPLRKTVLFLEYSVLAYFIILNTLCT
jgi:hypothetical protein